ncbi:Riboflavin transporter MCH5 [Lachnellula suecica]|uniref:Riboflavin transporter MCH5 n=1 Tax=Lachnellula suecica TaxID=602035 RepID=A0A8T9CB04_9HELO|nr:Riboflavin transporter MCH5 [Lachnellula suecica]
MSLRSKQQVELDASVRVRLGGGLVARRVHSIEELCTASCSNSTGSTGSLNGDQEPATTPRLEAFPLYDEALAEEEAVSAGATQSSPMTEHIVDALEKVIKEALHIYNHDEEDKANSQDDQTPSAINKATENITDPPAPKPSAEEALRDAELVMMQSKDAIHIDSRLPGTEDRTDSHDKDAASVNTTFHSPEYIIEQEGTDDNHYSTQLSIAEVKGKKPEIDRRDTSSSTKQRSQLRESTPFFTKRYSNPGKSMVITPQQLTATMETVNFTLHGSHPSLESIEGSISTTISGDIDSDIEGSTLVGQLVEDPIDDDIFRQQWVFRGCPQVNEESQSSKNGPEISNGTSNSAPSFERHDSEPPVVVLADELTYPEGGLRAWLVVVGGFCGMFASLGLAGTLGAFQTYFSENQLVGYEPQTVGWIFSIWPFMVFGCGVYIGPLFDVHGPKYLLLPGSILVTLMMFTLPYCTKYWEIFLVFGVLGGLGSSLIFTPSIAAPSHYFNRRRGNATGIISAGGACGGIVYPIILQTVVPKLGFTWATRIMGIITIVMLIIANLLITTRLPRTTRKPHPDFRILADGRFSATTLGVFMLEMGIFLPLTYLPSYAINNGYDFDFAYQALSILNVGSAFGRWLPGFFSDKIGRYNTAIIFIFVTIFSIFVCWLPFGDQMPGLVTFALLFGFASGSNISLTPVCIGQLCDSRDFGRYCATCYSIVSFGCLIGIPIAGQILQKTGYHYWGLIIWTGFCYVSAVVAFLVARVLGGGWKFQRIF